MWKVGVWLAMDTFIDGQRQLRLQLMVSLSKSLWPVFVHLVMTEYNHQGAACSYLCIPGSQLLSRLSLLLDLVVI